MWVCEVGEARCGTVGGKTPSKARPGGARAVHGKEAQRCSCGRWVIG